MESLGTLGYGDHPAIRGRWVIGQVHEGRYARCYGFILDYASLVSVSLAAGSGARGSGLSIVKGHDINGPVVARGESNGWPVETDYLLEAGRYSIVATSDQLLDFQVPIVISVPRPRSVEVKVTPGGNILVQFVPTEGIGPNPTHEIRAEPTANPASARAFEASTPPILLSLPYYPVGYSVDVRTKIAIEDGEAVYSVGGGERARELVVAPPPNPAKFRVGFVVTDGDSYGAVEFIDPDRDWYYTFLDKHGLTRRLPESGLSLMAGLPAKFKVGDHVTTDSVHGFVESTEWDAELQVWFYTFTDQSSIEVRLPETDLLLVPEAGFDVGDHVTDGTNHGAVLVREWVPADQEWYYTLTDQNGIARRLAESVLSLYGDPNPVTSLEATGGETSGFFQIIWGEPVGFDPATDSYEAQHLAPGASDWSPWVAVASQFGVTSRTEGEIWHVKVRVKRVIGSETLYSPARGVSFWREHTTISYGGSPPVNLQANDPEGDGSYKVTWEAPSDFGATKDRFEHGLDVGEGWTGPAEWAWTWFTTTPAPGDTYRVRVRTKYIDGLNVKYSSWVETSFTRPAAATNSPVSGLQVASSSEAGELGVSWTAPTGFDASRDVFVLRYKLSTDTVWTNVIVSDTGYTLTGLAHGLQYDVEVAVQYRDSFGHNSLGTSAWLSTTGTTAEPPPSKGPIGSISGLQSSDSDAHGSYEVSWTPPPGFDASTDDYEIQVMGTDGSWFRAFTWSWTWFKTSPDAGQTMTFRIRAKRVEGTDTSYSSWQSVSVSRPAETTTTSPPEEVEEDDGGGDEDGNTVTAPDGTKRTFPLGTQWSVIEAWLASHSNVNSAADEDFPWDGSTVTAPNGATMTFPAGMPSSVVEAWLAENSGSGTGSSDTQDHGDYNDHIDVAAVSHQGHQDHDDLSSMPHGDYNDHIDTPAVSHGDYADFIDSAGRPHSDHQDHDDVAAISHGDYADFIDSAGRPHSDHQDHDDVAAVSHGDYADFIDAAGRPHSDHQDHDDAYYSEFGLHLDHNDHDDLSSMPHGDYNDHIDTPAASHQDHQDHDDLSSMPHGDYNDHIDTPATTYGDYADFIDAAGRPHSDHQDHDDVAAVPHGDHDDHNDSS